MAEEFIWIVTDEESQSVLPPNSRDGQIRNPFDEPVELSTRYVTPVSAEKLKAGLTEFLQVMGDVISHAQQRAGDLAGMELEEIELSVEVNAEGQLSLLGTGNQSGGKGAMTLKFKKK